MAFQSYLKTIEPCEVTAELPVNYDILDNEIRVLDTSGHTSGHVSFYVPSMETLISGDVVVLANDKLELPFPQFAEQLEKAKQSIVDVSKLNISKVICYHGGTIIKDKETIRKLLLD